MLAAQPARPTIRLSSSRQRHRWRRCAKSEQDKIIDYESLEAAVPVLQRPINELKQVKNGLLYSWATLDSVSFTTRLAAVYALVFLLVGGPIAYQTFDPFTDFPLFFLAGSVGGLFVSTLLCLRIYLGWAYVGERLLSATIEYEETGWYDGQIFVKAPELLARDRLTGTYEVNPVMKRLRLTMLGLGASLLVFAALLVVGIRASADADGVYGRGASVRVPAQVSTAGILYSKDVGSLEDLINNDDAAAAEQAAQKGVPGYCGDRYFKAFAGGEEVCKKFEKR